MSDIERRFNYDETYNRALEHKDPRAFTIKAWGDPVPYFNQFIEPLIKNRNNLRVVEIGAGFGRYTKLIYERCSILFAIEESKICLDYLNKVKSLNVVPIHYKNINIVENDLDLIFSFSTMLHFNIYEIWWYMSRLTPKLKNGGHFVIHYSNLDDRSVELIGNYPVFGETGIYIFNHIDQLRIIGKRVSLEVISDEEPDNVIVKGHRVVVFRK